MPRLKPPFPAIAGLYAKPTVVNNVETLSTIPHIVQMGGAAYAEIGVNKSTGTRIVAISGHVKKPGNYEIEFGCTFRDVIYGFAGGIRDGHELKFFLPGGASFQWLVDRDEHLDAIYDMDFVQQNLGTTLGSGAVMVFDDSTDPVLVAWRLAKFYAHESCGKCTPCREGTGWIEKVLYRMSHGLGRPDDLDLLIDVGSGISPNVATAPFTQTTLCPLGPSVGLADRQPRQVLPRGDRGPRRRERRSNRVTTTEPKRRSRRRTPSRSPSTARPSRPKKGELLIKAAQENGVYIPRFCWHERMKPVGMCRMCLVEVEGVRGFPPACTTPVAEGMVCNTQSGDGQEDPRRRARVPAHQPPARLPGVRPRRRVPACRTRRSRSARASRVSSRRSATSRSRSSSATWCCSTASAASSAGAARGSPTRSRATADRLRRPRRSHAGAELRRAAVRLVLLRQHGADLPGRRAHRAAVPLQGAAVGPRHRRDVVQRVRGAVPGRDAVVVEPARAPARCRLRTGEPRLAVRQGSLRDRMDPLREPRRSSRIGASTASCARCRGRRRSMPRPG